MRAPAPGDRATALALAAPDAAALDGRPLAGFRALDEVCPTDHFLTRPIIVAPDVWRLAVEPALPHHRAEHRAWVLAFAIYERLLHARPTLGAIRCRVGVELDPGGRGPLRCLIWVRRDAVVVTLDDR